MYLKYPVVDNDTHLYYKTSDYDSDQPLTAIGQYYNGVEYIHESLMYGTPYGKINLDIGFKLIEYDYNNQMYSSIMQLINIYRCRLFVMWNKMDYLLIQFCGISTINYIDFLNEYNYPINLIQWIENTDNYNNTNISHEIGFSLDKNTFKTNRTAIYGIL